MTSVPARNGSQAVRRRRSRPRSASRGDEAEQVAQSGASQISPSALTAGEERQAQAAEQQVQGQGGQSAPRTERRARQQHGEGLPGQRDGGEGQRDAHLRQQSGEQRPGQDQAQVAQPGGGARQGPQGERRGKRCVHANFLCPRNGFEAINPDVHTKVTVESLQKTPPARGVWAECIHILLSGRFQKKSAPERLLPRHEEGHANLVWNYAILKHNESLSR